MTATDPATRSCRIVTGGLMYEGKQDLQLFAGISAETAGSTAICMHLLTIPPRRRGKAHIHHEHETVIYQFNGEVSCWYGDRLEHRIEMHAGEFLFIPRSVPHVPINFSHDTPADFVLARTDPNEQESTILLSDLDDLLPPEIASL